MVTDLRSLPSGFTLSDYRIEHVLGQGGFGITYLGVDTHLGRKVAIKEYYPREWAVRNNSYTINSAGSPDDKRNYWHDSSIPTSLQFDVFLRQMEPPIS